MTSQQQRRADEAHQRGSELAERRARLEAGEPSTADDVASAERAAEASADHDAEVHRRAAAAHRRAAEGAQAAGDPDRAAEHRAAADEDEHSAEA